MNNPYLENLFNHNDKAVLITGAAGQLGRELCDAFLNCGAKVFAVDIYNDILKKKLDKLHNDFPSSIFFYEMDITKKDSVEKTFEKIFSEHNSIDILINNAGVSVFEPFDERPEKSFDWVMDVNLKGTFFCIQSYSNKLMSMKPKGVIVNIASIYGLISPDFRIYTDCSRKNSEVYGATKAGIIQMTKYFAVHLAPHNIRVNCVSPGGIYNPDNPQGYDFVKNYSYRCPMGRMANTEDIVGGILYLSSEASIYVNGHNLVIDGGMSCW